DVYQSNGPAGECQCGLILFGKANAMKRVVKTSIMRLASILVLLAGTQAAWAQPFDWQKATSESQGMSSEKLSALKDELARRKTRAFLVIRNDKIVYEWYAEGNDSSKTQG